VTTPTEQSGKKAYHHGDLRQALLESALGLLEEVGVQGLSLRGVAARAGVSHAAPYRHFEDKESLIAAVAEDGFHKMFEHMVGELSRVAGGPQEQLMAMGLAYVSFAKAHPTHFRLMFGPHMAHEERHKCTREAGWRCHVQLVEVVRAGQAARVLPGGDADELAAGYWSLVQGLATLEINGFLSRTPGLDGADSAALTRRVLEAMMPTANLG
jgi:AcrR family transcriptional regulator